jgi:uncharacterized membrane protein
MAQDFQGAQLTDVNDNDKLMAALCYFLTPIVPIIVLLVDTMKVRPYQKYHALNALGLFVVELVFSIIVCICTTIGSFFVVGACLGILFFVPIIPNIYYAIIAYTRPTYFEIPVVTKFMIQQNMLTRP